MSYRRFIMADMIAAIISIPLMMWIGYIFSEQYETALNYASQIKTWSVVLGVVVLLLLLVLYLIRKQNKPPAAPKTSQTDI